MLRQIRLHLVDETIGAFDPKLDVKNAADVRAKIEGIVDRVIGQHEFAVTRDERLRLVDEMIDEVTGLGPLEPLLLDDSITEVMVNGPDHVYIERSGKILRVDATFQSNEHVRRIIDRIITPLGRRIDESSPRVDARLPDGSRVNCIIPPLSLDRPRDHHPQVLGQAVHGRRPDPVRYRRPPRCSNSCGSASRPSSTSSSRAAPGRARRPP